jgi:hypothetical protein
MQRHEQEIVERIVERYGALIDLKRSPGVILEILRDFGPNILRLLGELDDGAGGAPPAPSSIAIAGPGSPAPTLEDLFRLVLEVRQEVIRIGQQIAVGR